MKITSTIPYTLSINEPEGHGIHYQSNLETDTACLMMALQVLEDSVRGLKEAKKIKGADKKEMSKQIYSLSKTIQSLNSLTIQLCDSFELLKASADLKDKKLEIVE